MTSSDGEAVWIDIERIDLDKLAAALSASLHKWIAPENSAKYEGLSRQLTFTPLFIVQVPSHFEIVLALSVESQDGVGLAGYAAGYPRYRWSPVIYESIADSISFDTLAGDYPIHKVDFSSLGRITWIGESGRAATRTNSVDELLRFYNDLNEQTGQRIWINRDFISLRHKSLGLRFNRDA